VLIGSMRTLDGIAARISDAARELVEAFWPGGLTIVCHQQPSLSWDLGEAAQTVAVRMPLHPVALEVLREVGPMAVTPANKIGQPAPATAEEARDQLEYAVRIYLEAGAAADPAPSTIVDVTGDVPRVLRNGAVPYEKLRDVVPDILAVGS